MVRVDFLLQLRQGLDMPIVDLREIVTFESPLWNCPSSLCFFAFTPFIQGCKKLVTSP